MADTTTIITSDIIISKLRISHQINLLTITVAKSMTIVIIGTVITLEEKAHSKLKTSVCTGEVGVATYLRIVAEAVAV